MSLTTPSSTGLLRWSSFARDGDLAQLVGLRHKHFILTLQAGAKFETHRGILQHDDLIGKLWGTQVFSHMGSPFFLLQPSLADLLTELPRTTQILYPKDIGFILVTMGIGPGQTVLEAGTGSGSMATALAYAVGPQGRVVSYEVKQDVQNLARKNLTRFGLDSRVEFKLRDIQQGFDETDVDSLFLDLPNPYDYIPQVRAALKPGGILVLHEYIDYASWRLAPRSADFEEFVRIVGGVSLALGLIDLDFQILPDVLPYPTIAFGLVCSAFGGLTWWLDSLLGAAVGALLPILVIVIYKVWRGIEGMGWGDVKYLAAIGAVVGLRGVVGAALVHDAEVDVFQRGRHLHEAGGL